MIDAERYLVCESSENKGPQTTCEELIICHYPINNHFRRDYHYVIQKYCGLFYNDPCIKNEVLHNAVVRY